MADQRRPLFVYGTMLDPDVAAAVLGATPNAARTRRAWLAGYRRARVADETYPMLVETPGGRVPGQVILGLSRVELERVRFFESEEYDLVEVTVTVEGEGERTALRCGATEAVAGAAEDWDLAAWQAQHKLQYLEDTRRFMRLFGRAGTEEAERLWAEMKAREAERAR